MKLEILEGYDDYFDLDGTPLGFCIKRKTFHYKGIKVVLDKLPYLLNNTNGSFYFTTPAVEIISGYVDEAVEKGKKEARINQFGKFNRGKLPVGDNTEFRYSPAERFFIPGLIRDIPSAGFLTPVYFEKHVLVKFEHADGYDISNYTKSAGRIHGPEDVDVPYGVNKDGCVIMRLGDIVDYSQ